MTIRKHYKLSKYLIDNKIKKPYNIKFNLINCLSNKYRIFLVLFFICSNSYAAAPAPAEAKQGMVASSQHLATQVGVSILEQGGNAVDAAVAVGYALAVTDPCCGNIGGGGFMLIKPYNADAIFINFREKAPLAIQQSLYQNAQAEYDTKKIRDGYLAVAVPGTVMGLNHALAKYGSLSLSKVIQPAIVLARNGYILTEGDATVLEKRRAAFAKQPNVKQIFLKNGQSYQAGDRLIQTDLANTLQAIQQSGDEVFYNGWIADAIVKASNKHGGVLSQQDFAEYTITEETPITCTYQDYTIISAPPPSSGGVTLCEILGIVEAYPLKSLGFHSATSVHYLVESMRYAYADRNQYLGDPAFINNPLQRLLSEKHITNIQNKILPDKAGKSKEMGFIIDNESPQTTHYSVVDKQGNAVAVTYTLNGNFGAKVIAGNTGFFLNNEMDDFSLTPNTSNMFGLIQSESNAIAPGKRPLSSMTPTIVMQQDKVYMVLGAAGGSTIITQVLQAIINVVDYGMNIQQAIDAPRIHMQWMPDKIYKEPFSLSRDTEEKLLAMGYELQLGAPYGQHYWGVSNAILQDNTTHILYGASDSRRPGSLAHGY